MPKKNQVPPPSAPKKRAKNRAFLVLNFDQNSEPLPYLEAVTGNKGFKVTHRIILIS